MVKKGKFDMVFLASLSLARDTSEQGSVVLKYLRLNYNNLIFNPTQTWNTLDVNHRDLKVTNPHAKIVGNF